MVEPGSEDFLQGRVDLGVQAPDTVLGRGDLTRQVEVETSEHDQGGFFLVTDLECSQGVGHGAGRFSDDIGITFIGFRVAGM